MRTIREYPLIIEDHPEDYNGYPFLTVVLYHDTYYMTVIDNVNKTINAYVLDFCPTEHISEEEFITHVIDWWYNDRKRPLSFYFADKGLVDKFQPIYKKFNIDYVTRIIGPVIAFETSKIHTVQRKRVKKWKQNNDENSKTDN